MNTRNKLQEAGIFAIGLTAIVVIWIGLVFGLLGYLDPELQRWATTIMIAIVWPVSILVTRKLSISEAKAHTKGIEIGINQVSKAAHDAADIRTRMTTIVKQAQPVATPTSAPAAQWDQILPRPGSGARIISRAADDTTPIDM